MTDRMPDPEQALAGRTVRDLTAESATDSAPPDFDLDDLARRIQEAQQDADIATLSAQVAELVQAVKQLAAATPRTGDLDALRKELKAYADQVGLAMYNNALASFAPHGHAH